MNHSLTIKEFQAILLDMMEEFHTFCVQNDLTYYMVGGTLLGAVREKGFIPWDDDVDFAMPREDYEKLIRIYSGTLSLHSIQNDKNHIFPYIKLFHKTTPLLTVDDETYNFHADIFVKFDIYPIDGLGKTEKGAIKRLTKIKRKKKLLYLNLTNAKSKNPVKRILLFFIRSMSPVRMLRRMDRAMKKYTVNESVFLTRWREGGKKPNVVSKEVFGIPVLLPFEDHSFYAPQDSHTYLTLVYGDYTVREQCNVNPRHNAAQNDFAKKLAKQITEQKEG